ncbi:MAG TPA: nucleotidyltransferase family protein, partial [Thermodesulfovibrionales bacterium]|nr:nucleotidyltransferase family protein [Thermodesulfovibrionales bacterium]
REDVSSALALLQRSGWTPKGFTPTEEYVSARYAHGFKNENDQEFDLHWHLLSQCREAGSDKDFWEGAVETEFHGVPTHVLNATDQLLHICIHGARWNAVPPFRWVADAAIILTTAQSEIDWDRLIAQAQKRRLVLPLRETLHYLRTVVDAPIPVKIVEGLQGLLVPKIEQLEYIININPLTRWTAVIDLWCQHSRSAGDTMLLNKLILFPRFLKRVWGKSLWKIPFYGLLKIVNWNKKPLAKKL